MKPISRTAYICCGLRAADAVSERPICGDQYAERFMAGEGHAVIAAFEGIRHSRRFAAGNLARHRIVDDLLREELAADPNLLVVVIGAGFESRAYRLPAGTWVELDEPQVFALKDQVLPLCECPNTLQRIPIDFATESLPDKLAPFARPARVIVVVEGVLMYLEPEQIRDLLRDLGAVFPRHTLVCELMDQRFFDKHASPGHARIQDLGAEFKYTPPHPEELFQQNGYRLDQRVSIMGKCVDIGAIKVPKFLIRLMMPAALSGYTMHVFEKG